jgi:hypothetical protein
MIDTVRQLIDTHGNLRVPTLILTPDADLYAVGLTPFAAIQVTLALERFLLKADHSPPRRRSSRIHLS